jgi:hypothetical protein
MRFLERELWVLIEPSIIAQRKGGVKKLVKTERYMAQITRELLANSVSFENA